MKGLEALQRLFDHNYGNDFYIKAEEDAEIIEKELKALETLKGLIGDIEIEQYNKKPNRYELRMCGKAYYINEKEYQALKEVLL